MGQALYRKYRSKSLDEVIGQDHITGVLKNTLKKASPSHAYLFAGPRGVGKTSVARILAHAINDFEYNSEAGQLDVIEIDAASNRGIDEIRDLREKVSIAPVRGKYKVYIIDEVHMLTTPAFNALLKTLEEPPEHVVFILATTEVHKLPATIVSRTQRHNFQPIHKADAVNHLKQIAKQEGIKVDQAALELVANHGDGSFRDSISLLDQLSGQEGGIDADSVAHLLGIPPEKIVDELLYKLSKGLSADIVRLLDDMSAQGYHPAMTAKILAAKLRQSVLNNNELLPAGIAFDLLERLIDVPASRQPDRLLEVILIKNCSSLSEKTTHIANVPVAKKHMVKTEMKDESSVKKPVSELENAESNKPAKTTASNKGVTATTIKPSKSDALRVEDIWPQLLSGIKSHHNTLYGILRMAEPVIKEQTLVLNFSYGFHQKRMQEPRYQAIILDSIQKLTGHVMVLDCVHSPNDTSNSKVHSDEASASPAETDYSQTSDNLKAVSNIFGAGELLES